METWAVEALSFVAEAFKRCQWITLLHQRAHNARGAQSSSDGVVGGVEPEEDRALAKRPATAWICCSTTAERHDAADAELCANRSCRWLRGDE